MNNSMPKPNNKVGDLLIPTELLLPVLAYLDVGIEYGKNIMLILSVLVVFGLCITALVLSKNHKISKWLFWLTLISGIALLGSNIVAYNSTGYSILFYTSFSISVVILLATYTVFQCLLKKNKE
ncbi:MAG: hypothetical protein ACI3Z5_05140 [Paludibacteraceae bacterium]